MGRWERIAARLEAMDEDRREARLEEIEDLLDAHDGGEGEGPLTDEQAAEVRRRVTEPIEYASDEEVEAFFADVDRS
jgi:hypothetical protein